MDRESAAPRAATLAERVGIFSFGLALLLGGAGLKYPLLNGLIQIAAIATLWLFAIGPRPAEHCVSRRAVILVVLIALLPLAQLIPLPPDVWMNLPGRGLAIEMLKSAGIPPAWRPLSLDPEATLRSFLDLLPALAAFCFAVRAAPPRRLQALYLILVAAVISAILGALQKATGGDPLVTPFLSAHSANGPGLFVNRNHQATLLLVSIVLAAGLSRVPTSRGRDFSKVVPFALIFLFSAGVVATTSRMGLVLLPLALLFAAAMLMSWTWKNIAAALVLLIGVGAAATQTSAVRVALSRFTSEEDVRLAYWRDVLVGLEQYHIAGTGIGTFPRVFPPLESLEIVGPNYVANAHNDYLEVILEGGLPAALLLAAFLFMFAGWAFSALRMGSAHRALHPSAIGAVLLIMLHSIVDYPLRMSSVSAVFALLCGLLACQTGIPVAVYSLNPRGVR